MYQQHSLEVSQGYFKKDTKAWFSPVWLICSHSLLRNIISNRTGVNSFFIALIIISQISVWISMRIQRKCFVFNRVRLFYFKEKTATPLRHGSKTIKKHLLQWNVFIRIFLFKWKLLKHLRKRKKMGKIFTRSWTLGWGIAEVSLTLWKRK